MKLHVKHLIMVSTLLLMSTVIAGCEGRPSPDIDPKNASADASSIQRVTAQGRILPAQGFTRLAAVGTVKQVHVHAGQQVKQGELLVTMQSRAALTLQLKVARERLEEAQQQKDLAETQALQLLKSAQRKVDEIEKKKQLLVDQDKLLDIAKEQLQASQNVLSRLEAIADSHLKEFVGQLEIDRQKVSIQEAKLQVEEQQVAHQQAENDLKLSEFIATTELESAQQSLAAARSSRAVAIVESEIEVLRKQSEAARIRAPTNGEIIAVNVKAGESSVQLPIIEMADTAQLVCEVEINELDAARVHENDKASMTSRAFNGETIRGIVKRKSNVVGRPQLKPFDPLAPVDYRSVTAVIELDEASRELASQWLQLQVEVEIEVAPRSASPTSNSTSVAG